MIDELFFDILESVCFKGDLKIKEVKLELEFLKELF